MEATQPSVIYLANTQPVEIVAIAEKDESATAYSVIFFHKCEKVLRAIFCYMNSSGKDQSY